MKKTHVIYIFLKEKVPFNYSFIFRHQQYLYSGVGIYNLLYIILWIKGALFLVDFLYRHAGLVLVLPTD